MDRLTAMKAFVRLVELGTFSAVADELRIKQSTVSKWMVSLEEELGVQLVTRTSRRVRVTESGDAFYTRAKSLLADYEEMTAHLQARAPELQGRLRVSLPVVFGTLYVVPWLPTFMKAHPHVELNLIFDDSYANLMGDELDVIIRVGIAVDSSLKAKLLGRTTRRIVASPSYLEEAGRPQNASELAAHPVLRHTGALRGEPWVLKEDDEVIRVPVRARMFANNSQALLEAAKAGLGIALLADWLVDPFIASGELVAILEEVKPPPAPIQALMAPGRVSHPRVRAFVDGLADALAGRFGGQA